MVPAWGSCCLLARQLLPQGGLLPLAALPLPCPAGALGGQSVLPHSWGLPGAAGQLEACDYVGIASGNKVADQVSKAGFTARKSEFVDAPLIEELPLALECELVSYDIESNHMVGRIVNVSADESVLGEDGLVDVDLLRPLVYDPSRLEYRVVGGKVGKAFSDGKKLA